ncbi:MAG: GDP-mannose 4,6-dehydratase [Patescibacteria group bacterium]
MKILVTGITGFVGGHFTEYIASAHPDVELHGTSLTPALPQYLEPIKGHLTLHECNIDNKGRIQELIDHIRPDALIHLAAQSYVSTSWENPETTLHTNIIGQSNLLEAVRAVQGGSYNPIILIACSSEEYGQQGPQEGFTPLPITVQHKVTGTERYDGNKYLVTGFTEESSLQPLSPYALSKIAQDYMGYQYWRAYGMKVIRLRAFNHTGPRRDPVFGVSGFCKKVAEIEKGLRPPQLEVRDLTAVRDFTDVRDVVQAYWLAVEKCKPGEVYNVCSGRGYRFQDIISAITKLSRVQPIALVPDPKGLRPTDGGIIIGNNRKFCTTTGWQPKFNFLKHTIPDILEYWRNNIS